MVVAITMLGVHHFMRSEEEMYTPPMVYFFPIVPVHSINLQAGTLSVLRDALCINSVTNVALDRWYYLWIHVSTQSYPILQMEFKGDCK